MLTLYPKRQLALPKTHMPHRDGPQPHAAAPRHPIQDTHPTHTEVPSAMPSRSPILLPFFCLLALACLIWGCDRSNGQVRQANAADPPPAQKPAQAPALKDAPPTAALPADVQRGICLAHNYQHGGRKGYGSQESMSSKKELVALGTNWVSLTPFGWQRSLKSREMSFNPNIGPGESDARMEAETKQARELGLKIMLKPHIWINYSEWRGHIDPEGEDGWDVWFASYTKFILHYARMAQRLKHEALVIGLELASASPHRDHWLKLIEEVRKVYDGKIIYAANWNETHLVAFWDKVDWIGVQFFNPLSDSLNPTYDELSKALHKHLDTYEPLAKKYNKPVILTEFGYKSIKATTASPGTWPEHLSADAKAYDEVNQALAYKALLNAVGKRTFVKGVYVWKWFTDVHTDEEGRIGFSPWKKAASEELKKAYGLRP